MDTVAEAPHLSLVIPVYNEEESLPILAREIQEALRPLELAYEVIFVDDGSRDRSVEVIRALAHADQRIRMIRFKTNAGETGATDAGLRYARGACVVTMDADLQNDPRDIPLLLSHLREADAACGWRVRRDDPWIRRVSSRIANGVRNFLSNEEIRDAGCTFRAMRRGCLDGIKLFRGMHRFIPTLLRMERYRVVEVPVSHRPRRFGQSKYGVSDRMFSAFYDLIAVRWMKRRRLDYEIVEE